jgi:hypothetical protein
MIRSICIDSYIFVFVVNRPGFVGRQQERAFLLLPNARTQPRRADDVNRESGTECAIRRWLQ